MKNLHILLFDAGDFITTNPMVVVTCTVLVLGVIAGYIRLEIMAQNTRADVDNLMDDMARHTGNSDAHVNQLYISTLKDRIGNVESDLKTMRHEMNSGHQKISDKIDTKFEALAQRMGK